MTHRPHVSHTFTSELCKELILWTWTLDIEQVVFEDEQYILEQAKKLTHIFTGDVPIVDNATMHIKLAKLSASLACRTFSITNSKAEKVFVRKCHVDYIVQFIIRTYTSKAFAYDKYTSVNKEDNTLRHAEVVKKTILQCGDPQGFVYTLKSNSKLTKTTIMYGSGCTDRETLDIMIGTLVRNRALKSTERYLYPTQKLLELLETIEFDEKPAFVNEGGEF